MLDEVDTDAGGPAYVCAVPPGRTSEAGRSERVRGRGTATGSTMTGVSSPPLALISGSGSGGVCCLSFSFSLSLSLSPRPRPMNLPDFREILEDEGVGGTSVWYASYADDDVAVSFTDLLRSRLTCFWRNFGSLVAFCCGWICGLGVEEEEDAVCREFLLDIKKGSAIQY